VGAAASVGCATAGSGVAAGAGAAGAAHAVRSVLIIINSANREWADFFITSYLSLFAEELSCA
jgi:hypothetical protein